MMNPDIDVRHSKIIELRMQQCIDRYFFEIRTDFDMKILNFYKARLEQNDPCAG